VEAVRWPAKYKSDVSQLLLAVNKEKNVWKKFENWKGISNKTKFQKDFNSAIDKMSKWAATVALDVGVYPQTKAILKQLTGG
jgi:Zn-dependent oligopeptidase